MPEKNLKENPFVELSLKQAKAFGLYQGALVSRRDPRYEWEPVTYDFKVRVRGYSYLKKIRGKKRKVRISVRGYSYLRIYYFEVPRLLKVRPKETLEKVKTWMNVHTFMRRWRAEYEIKEMDLIYHRDMAKDVVSPYDSFVWSKPLTFKNRLPDGSPDYILPTFRKRILKMFRGARIWFLLHIKGEDAYLIGSRSSLFPFRTETYSQAHFEMEKMREAIRDYYDSDEQSEYFDLIGFVAFTVYQGMIEKMPYFKPKRKTRVKRSRLKRK